MEPETTDNTLYNTPKVEKAPKAPKKKKGKWVTIFRTTSEDYDEELRAHTGAQTLVDLQQHTVTKEVRTVRVEEG